MAFLEGNRGKKETSLCTPGFVCGFLCLCVALPILLIVLIANATELHSKLEGAIEFEATSLRPLGYAFATVFFLFWAWLGLRAIFVH